MKTTSFKIKILGCRNLSAKDKNGLSDPFVTIRLDTHKFQTKVIQKSLNPTFNQEFILSISSSNLQQKLLISVWDKDILSNEFLGFIEFAISDLVQDLEDFEDPDNHPEWFPLSSRHAKEQVSGDICVQFGLVGYLEPSLKQIADSVHVIHHASLVSTEDPAEDLYFNHYVDFHGSEEQLGESMENVTIQEPDVQEMQHSEMAGILLMEIVGARDLPYEKNTLKTTFNCDPFAVASYGKTTFRTKVIRHSLNPTWNQVNHFHLKRGDIVNNWPIKWCLYDFERFTKNNAICEADIPLSTLLNVCEKPIKNPYRPTAYNPVDYDINLTVKNQRTILEGSSPILNVRVSYIPYSEIRRNFWLALLNQYSSSLPTDPEPRIDRVSFETMLDSMESNFSEETINNMFAMIKKAPTDELTFVEAIEVLESKIRPDLVSSMGNVHPIGIETERLMMMKKCPICQKRLNFRGDFDVVSHFALCSHGNMELLDQMAMGGFLTQESASSKWFTKIFSYVTFGGLGIGKNSGYVLFQDRATGQLVKEKMPTYIRLGIRLLYQVAGSKSTVESRAIKRLLRNMTLKQGIKFDSPRSKANIGQFVAYHNLDLDEVLDPIESFQNFNQFFYRKLKPGSRVLASPDPEVAVCPADARTNCFESIKTSTELWIKGSKFSVESLLGSDELAHPFKNGSLAIFRLAPQDYHRFHIPVDGTITHNSVIEGTYFTVNPMAVRTTVDVFTENARTVTIIDSTHHGKVAYVCIGAMMVGSIVLTTETGQQVKRLDEHGYFKFGGSTIVLLFEKERIQFDNDLVENSKTCLETLVKVGNSLGCVYK